MVNKQRTLIKGGIVCLPQGEVSRDILIEGEKIVALGTYSPATAERVIHADGLLVLPGAIDPHVHFNDEFMKTTSVHDYLSGTRAAAFGGVTSVIDFSNQGANQTLTDTIQKKHEEAAGLAVIDWGVHPVITRPDDKTLHSIAAAKAMGAPTIKCYLTYREEGLMVTVRDLRKILEKLRDVNGRLLVHAEDNEILETNIDRLVRAGCKRAVCHAMSRPETAEIKAIQQCIQAARETGGNVFIVHMAAAEGVDLISTARSAGIPVHAETCTHYLYFTRDILEREDGFKWICSPPLRTEATKEKLWQGLQQGVISLVSSDDAAYSWAAKCHGLKGFEQCPNGIPGVEVRLPLLYSEGVKKGRISLRQWVDLVAVNPARLFGLFPQKGSLTTGSDADIILFDTEADWQINQDTLHMAPDWSAYENIKVTGKVNTVLSRGDVIIENGHCSARPGRGRFLHRELLAR